MVEVHDNVGQIRGYVVVMNLTSPETGLSEIKHRFVSMEEIEAAH